MATYAIGDIQGCFNSFQDLLKLIQFNQENDRLWFVGDIVNRGAGSLSILKWVYEHQDSVVMVLGNHDLHTLVLSEGYVRAHPSDTLDELLESKEAPRLLNWLRHQPLVHYDHELLMVHAGLLPSWSISQAISLANEVESALRGNDYCKFLESMYGNQPTSWSDSLTGWDRLRVITNAITRLRLCTNEGVMEFKYKGELDQIPSPFVPWFQAENRESASTTIVFGHWSAVGLYRENNVIALDTGCLWGGQLTAMRIEDRRFFQVPCRIEDAPLRLNIQGQ
jgi:bis(5'-nucleosyl)-tetraphosphatase (symmetrical)